MNANARLVKEFLDKMSDHTIDKGLAASILREYMADNFENFEPPQLPVGGVFRGWDASLRIIAIYNEHWHQECLKTEIFGDDNSNLVAAKGLWQWTSVETGRSHTGAAVELFTVENGKIKAIEVFQFDPAAIVATLPGKWRY